MHNANLEGPRQHKEDTRECLRCDVKEEPAVDLARVVRTCDEGEEESAGNLIPALAARPQPRQQHVTVNCGGETK